MGFEPNPVLSISPIPGHLSTESQNPCLKVSQLSKKRVTTIEFSILDDPLKNSQ